MSLWKRSRFRPLYYLIVLADFLDPQKRFKNRLRSRCSLVCQHDSIAFLHLFFSASKCLILEKSAFLGLCLA
ncbi:hypothetical protein EDC96DRAFT_509385 [Choanephora cucurbitarum]|nr:hypothetical protein EDC96DRAFT_509385 [Choanephora cucurbitarum]